MAPFAPPTPGAAARVAARPAPLLELAEPVSPSPGLAGVRIVADLDDSDGDGRTDAFQSASVPTQDLIEMRARSGRAELSTRGPIRLIADGRPQGELSVRGTRRFYVQGVSASERAGDAQVRLTAADGSHSIWTFTVIRLRFMRPNGDAVVDARDALGISHEVTNDDSLPRGPGADMRPGDPEALRVVVDDASGVAASEVELRASPASNRPHVALVEAESGHWASPWMRLVGDAVDEQAPAMGGQTLRVALRDEVEIRYISPTGVLRQGARVGRPGSEDGPRAARYGRLRVRVLRARVGGRPSIGGDDAGALRIAREQVQIANEIWLQCDISFGAPAAADVAVVNPPPPYLLAVADQDGLPAAGGGVIRFRVDGRALPPVTTRVGDAPTLTALRIARALESAGYAPRVLENQRIGPGAGPSADVLVRRADGTLAHLSRDGEAALSTDAAQRLRIAEVDLRDGLQEFENATAVAGSLEERALLHAVMDVDPATIDMIIVPRFALGTRQGESFIEADRGTLVNVVVLDRNGIAGARSAWTQSHELGHVLLDDPFHPDNVGPNRPWLLMDSDSSLPRVTGPKRLTADECRQVRERSGVAAHIRLLAREASH